MFNALIRWSLRRRGLVLGLAILPIAASAYRIPQMPIEGFPETGTVDLLAHLGHDYDPSDGIPL